MLVLGFFNLVPGWGVETPGLGFSVAYTGYASGDLDKDAWALRYFANERGLELMVLVVSTREFYLSTRLFKFSTAWGCEHARFGLFSSLPGLCVR